MPNKFCLKTYIAYLANDVRKKDAKTQDIIYFSCSYRASVLSR